MIFQKTKLFLFFILLQCASSYSQDVIYLKGGDSLTVNIFELGKLKVKYKKISNPTGPVYILTSNDVESIKLKDGSVLINRNDQIIRPNTFVESKNNQESTNDEEHLSPRKKKSLYYNKKKNIISYNYAALIYVSMEFSYERILDKTGFIGLKIPISLGLGIKTNYIGKPEIFTTGLHVNIYPFGQGRVVYFTGPAIRYSIFNEVYSVNPNNSLLISVDPIKSSYLGFYMNNGVTFRATPFLSFSLSMGFGVRNFLQSSSYSQFHVIGEGSINFRF